MFGFAPTRRRAGWKDLLQPDGAVGPVLWISLVGIVGGDQPRQWAVEGVRHGAILGRSLGVFQWRAISASTLPASRNLSAQARRLPTNHNPPAS